MTPPANILVRPARPGDAAALRAILRDTFDSTWRPNISAAAAQAFYAARGYREAGRYPDEEWNSGLTTLLLVKALG